MRYQTAIGRLRYRTAEEARGAARDLGISGVHSHKEPGINGGERFWMPGENHNTLNQALEARGLPPTPMPGTQSGMMGMGMPTGDAEAPDLRMADQPDGELPEMAQPEPADDPFSDIVAEEPFVDSLTGGEDDDGEMELY